MLTYRKTVQPLIFIILILISSFVSAQDDVTDLSGIWVNGGLAPRPDAPYTEAGQAAHDAWESVPLEDPGLSCVLHFGRNTMNPLATEILQTDDVIYIMYEYMHQNRRVYLNIDEHPRGDAPSLMGHSYGYWDGSTLVVHTGKILPGPLSTVGIPSSEELEVTERFSLGESGDELIVEMTFDDPLHLTRPMVFERTYRQGPAEMRIHAYDCMIRAHN